METNYPFFDNNEKLQGILNELNESQREAVAYTDGPSLVIAGAGSGKTRVLTYKIAYLLQMGVEPWRILALTFTNKAAKEMVGRIGELVGSNVSRYVRMGTFHSIFSRILRRESGHIGYASNFTIYDESDSRSLIKSIIKEMGLNDKVYKPATVHTRISMAKNHMVLPNEYANHKEWLQRDKELRMPAIHQIYTAYCSRCRQANAMDFDDLLMLTFILFRENEEIRKNYADNFFYVLVDEYQDTNAVQQKILWQLTKDKQRVCVVGDDAQSIYGFRGARIDNILDFQKIYTDVKLFKLERNYRSTQHIVQAANSLIKHNQHQIPKDVYSRNDMGDKLVLKTAYSDKEEALIVCNDIKSIKRKEHCAYSDFAILYRTNSQSRSFEEAMRTANIPYRIYGGLSFYQRKEIKDIIAYFRVVANPDDEEAIKRIINYPTRGIGATTISKISAAAVNHGVSFWKVVCNPEHYGVSANKGTCSKINNFRLMIKDFIGHLPIKDAYTLGTDIIKMAGISADLYSETDPEALSRQENLEEFLGGMKEFVETRCEEGRETEVSLLDYLQEVALLTDLDSNDGNDSNRVMLMTIHSAKGLEFPTIFIVGLEENIFPSPPSTFSKRELEEERRLLYVAITRAEKHCFLTCAKNRWRYGKMEFDTPSRFIQDIDPALIKVAQEDSSYNFSRDFPRQQNELQRTFAASRGNLRQVSEVVHPSKSPHPQSLFESQNNGLQEGNVIEHDRFGIGTIVKMEGTGENTKATVQFRNVGIKQLLLKFARYKIIA